MKSGERLFSFLRQDILSVVQLHRAQVNKIRRAVGNRVFDILFSMTPEKYERRVLVSDLSGVNADDTLTCAGKVISWKTGRGRRPSVMTVDIGNGRIDCVFFGRVAYSYMRSFPVDTAVLLSGKMQASSFVPSLAHPEVYRHDAQWEKLLSGIVPVYPAVKGVSSLFLLRTVAEILRRLNDIDGDWMPHGLYYDTNGPDLVTAVIRTHFPKSLEDSDSLNSFRTPFHRRMARDRIFFFHYGMERLRSENRVEKNRTVVSGGVRAARTIRTLPFSLTAAQNRSLEEIRADLSSPYPMNRLLQGDVGSGKTVVMLLASLDVIESGYRAVLMAPTGILAEQHCDTMQKLLEDDVSVVLLIGGLTGKKRRERLRQAREADIVVGTHALYEHLDEMDDLGLVMIDEQHRFGVAQRMRLMEKASNPDVLVISATPIPRSLSLTLYGGVDISVIDEMPPGRIPVTTRFVPALNREKVVGYVERIVGERNSTGYWVCPLVEESDESDLRDVVTVHGELRERCGDAVALLHGRMKQEEKRAVMERLRNGDIRILVSTIVIEVGVDIPDATFIVVENAERFGLAQLHQLRGRVGRGSERSFAALIAGEEIGEAAQKRLSFMASNSDGFKVAEFDLKQRGPGALTGLEQSGFRNDPIFLLAARYGAEVQGAKNMTQRVGTLGTREQRWIAAVYDEFFSDDVRRYQVG